MSDVRLKVLLIKSFDIISLSYCSDLRADSNSLLSQVLWFSAIFPYVILTILCVKALTLEGAMMGLEFLFTPDWARLAESQVWIGKL